MKYLTTIMFWILTISCSGHENDQKVISNTLTDQHVSVAGTKVSMILPEGFEKAENFNGFQHIETGSSIIIVEMPGPFSEYKKGFTKAKGKSHGMDLIDKQDITINGFSAILIEAVQPAYGTIFNKYILVFGTEQNTIMINGTFPKELKKVMSADIKKSLLSVVYETDKNVNPLDEIGYSVNIENTKLKYANSMAKSVLYSVDGKIPPESEDKTFFILGSSLNNIEIVDKKQFAIDRVNKTATFRNIDIEKIQEIEINGLFGYEIIANGINDKTGKMDKIYYVILFNDTKYYLMIGIADNDYENNIELFKKVSKTFRLK